MRLACIETLEDRRQFAATVGLDPVFSTVVTKVGDGYSSATLVLPLPRGRVLVYGRTSSPTAYGTFGAVFAMYDAHGQLDTSFHRNGLLIQDNAASSSFGYVDGLQLLPDGGVLASTEHGVRRMEQDGTIDATFGNSGLLPKHTYAPVILADGSIQAQQSTYDRTTNTGTTRVLTFDAHGRYLAETPFVNALSLTRLSDGRFAGVTDKDRFTVYSHKLQPDATFGTTGTAYVGAAARRWAAKHGPWYVRTVTKDTTGHFIETFTPTTTPTIGLGSFSQTADGGFQVGFYVRDPHSRANTGNPYVQRSFHLTASGAIVDAVMPLNAVYAPAPFTPATNHTSGGMFHFSAGADVTVRSTVGGDLFTNPYGAVAAADGSYYLFGQINNGLGVVHTVPVIGSISGVLFGDTNHSGQADSNEARNAGKVVYLDANNNGQRDPAELWTTSDASGHYAFDDLGPGPYVVRRELPQGFEVTRPAQRQWLTTGQKLTVSIGSAAA